MVGAVKVLIAAAVFSGIQYFTSKSMGLLAALAANLPFFTLYAYSVSDDPRRTALYLACFTWVISASFFAVYLLPVKSRNTGAAVVLATWLILSLAVFLGLLKNWR